MAQDQGLVLNAHSMVYHETEQITYIFGGATSSSVVNDLWVFDGKAIVLVEQDFKPGPRTFASMTYRPTDSSLLLFGGSEVLFGDGPDIADLKNDTWLYKSNQWTKLNPASSPSPRAHAAMAYDEARGRLVLFGGYRIEKGKYLPLGGTWEFYDNNWHLRSEEGPTARMGSSMAYDQETQRIILFGGNTGNRNYGEATGETWSWDGKSWVKLRLKQPENRFDSNMVFDRKENQLLRFGGWTGKTRTNETWVLQNAQWQQKVLALLPPARNHSQMIYDMANEQIILFGGHNGSEVFGDLWVFQSDRWQKLIDTAPQKRMQNQH